ncbi:MAG: acyl-ACP--UDP-N-acetylglucosamine O-acyltransferase [Deltaproteobacteria bacterium]|nr:acyl-ACP--UDP-N-acetylglucosamine O-acyltransferase [Deltaproteobacteria bacterium]
MTKIHSTAVIDSGAIIGEGCEIGPYTIIGKRVKIGKDTKIGAHTVIEGNTEIGENNNISHLVTIGTPPQDIGYKGEDTRVVIGDNNTIREYATIHRATTKQDWVTKIGNNNYLMSYTHIAHDCVVGNNIIMVNGATLGGHTTVGDRATLSAFTASHQFVRIGAYAMISGVVGIPRDIPPYMMASGSRASLYGLNLVGLRRNGFKREAITGLRKAYRIIWRESTTLNQGIKRVKEEMAPFPELDFLLDFISSGSKRGITRGSAEKDEEE